MNAAGDERRRSLERMLRARRSALVRDLEEALGERLGEDAVASLGEQIEIGDRAVAAHGQEIEIQVVERKRRELREIERALERLSRGEYGRCERCGDEIDADRLAVVPFAVECVQCRRRRETEEKRVETPGRGFRSGFRDIREDDGRGGDDEGD